VIHCIGKDPALRDAPANLAKLPWCALNDHPSTHELLRGIRKVLDSYPGERISVGEVVLFPTRLVAPYYGRGDELHLSFNFMPLHAPWEAAGFRERIEETRAALDPVGAWPTWVLSNHDNPRHRTRYGGSETRARAAAFLLLGLRGTPFLYAGEELGLEDAPIPVERRLDPGGRDGCRAPIPWDATPAHGWGSKEAWLPWPPEAELRSAAEQRGDPSSILHLYRRLLSVRRASASLRLGDYEPLPAPDGALAWLRTHDGDRRAVAINFTSEARAVPIEGSWTIEVSTEARGEGDRYTGRLGPDQAVVLR
jgi:alpha-glucosidase